MSAPLPVGTPPVRPVPESAAPQGGRPYRVCDGDDWVRAAKIAGVDAPTLIAFNFQTTAPDVVNWYLHEYVGCVQVTSDRRNWVFSSGLQGGRGVWSGGVIWLPSSDVVVHSNLSIMKVLDKTSPGDFGGGGTSPPPPPPPPPPPS
jgi:hypothetical protein